MHYKQKISTFSKKTVDKAEIMCYIKGEERIGTEIKNIQNPPKKQIEARAVLLPENSS